MIPLDYDVLRLIWWGLLGLLLIGFAVMDGFDLGAAMLLRLVTRSEPEREAVLETIEPVWDGNQVWFILGGGTAFAAWPPLYAASFSGFYLVMLALLLALIVRPVGLMYRGKVASPVWRAVWDALMIAGALVAAFVFGAAFGNLLLGVPFALDPDLRPLYEGRLLSLFAPFAVLAGGLSVVLLAMHGAAYLAVKADPVIARRARRWVQGAAVLVMVLFGIGGLWVSGLDGHVVTAGADPLGPSNPLTKSVAVEPGAWLANFHSHPWLLAVPGLGFAGALAAIVLVQARYYSAAFVASAAAVAGVVATPGISLFPFLLPSALQPDHGLTVWDASSSPTTLFIMLVATALFLPLVVAYTAWVFRVLGGRVRVGHAGGEH